MVYSQHVLVVTRQVKMQVQLVYFGPQVSWELICYKKQLRLSTRLSTSRG
jgi:hypothetical protein